MVKQPMLIRLLALMLSLLMVLRVDHMHFMYTAKVLISAVS